MPADRDEDLVPLTGPVTLSNCDVEPIHIPGSIQRHGAMLVCDPQTHRLVHASRNAALLTGYPGDLIPGLHLAAIIGEKYAHDLRNAVAKAPRAGLAGIVLGLSFTGVEGLFDAAAHLHDGRLFVEIEPCLDSGESARRALDLTRTVIHRIGAEDKVERVAATGAKLIRAMLGYDRVMVYRFLHNGAGRVIAEAKSSALASFMGQHFPAADIPAQARRLYLSNTIRMISDAAYEPIPLEPPLAPGERPVDMSFAQLRSVSPIHCEYLRNMGVSASLSISIVVEGELWGLIACHHDSPKVTPLPLRIGAELFGQYFSLQITVAERRTAMMAASAARARLDGIVAGLSADGAILPGLVERLPDFADLTGCDGAALWMDGLWNACGATPDQEAARALLAVANREAPRGIWTTQELRAHIDPGSGSDLAGAIAIPLSMAFDDYLILFRNEEAHAIEWAGEPVKTVLSTPSGARLTPRGSFETWREEVRGRSTPWTEADLSVAEAIGTYLRDVILRQNEVSAEERVRTEQRRRILNAELNHRVKNIIALVTSIARQTGAGAQSVEDYSDRLEGRLRALAFAHDQSQGGADGGSLSSLTDTETDLYRREGAPDRVTVEGERLRLDGRAFGVLALVLHEMMTNAVKYGSLSVSDGRLAIAWRRLPGGDCELTWRESGGPSVQRPARSGFGTKLIRSVFEYDLRGTAEMSYNRDGLTARFIIPAAHVAPDDAPARQPVQSPETPLAPFNGLSALIVEDQGLIAMDAEDILRRLGATDIRLAPSAEDALAALESFTPDIAVVDFNLGSETSEVVADRLVERKIPFVFTTGYSDRVMIPAHLRQIPLVRKPISEAAIAAQIHAATRALGEGS